MTAAEVCARVVMLDSMQPVSNRQNSNSEAPWRVFHVTAEGRRNAGISDARQAT